MRSHYRVRIQIGGVGALDVFTDSGEKRSIGVNIRNMEEMGNRKN